ncbi:MAG: TraB/GumN family protein [Deltaproteobacteria bacterium]
MFSKTIRPVFIGLLICLLYAGHLSPALSDNSGNSGNKHFLWRVSSETNNVYILGSLHLLNEKHYPLSEVYENAFDDSRILVFEVDPGVLDEPETARMMLSKATLPRDKTLSGVLSEETYTLTKEKLGDMGVNIIMFSKSKPWFIALTAGMLKLKSMGLNPEYGLDRYFYDRAAEEDKEVVGLETAEYQVDLLASVGGDKQDELLLQTLTELDLMEEEINKLIAAWSSGDDERFETIIFKSYEGYPEIYERLIVERNKNWLPRIEEFTGAGENYMVVVGSAHLVGKDGLINLLRKKGHEVEQMQD